MQTLNVGAGQTDKQYKEAEEQRRADLLAESQSDANYFFVAAGLAALGTGILPIRVNLAVSIGTVDMLTVYGRALGPMYGVAIYAVAAMWVVVLVGLGFAGRAGQRWAFLVGIALYALDMVALLVMFEMLAFGVHAFFLLKWFQGQRTLNDFHSPGVSIVAETQAAGN
jgi:hypothetical protein